MYDDATVLQGTRYLVSNGAPAAGYTPYYAAATPYTTPGATASAPTGTPVYPALAAPPPPTAATIQYSMPTTIENGCCAQPQMVFVGGANNGGASTAPTNDRLNDVRIHRVSKNIPDIFDSNVNKNSQILILFGANIPDTT